MKIDNEYKFKIKVDWKERNWETIPQAWSARMESVKIEPSVVYTNFNSRMMRLSCQFNDYNGIKGFEDQY